DRSRAQADLIGAEQARQGRRDAAEQRLRRLVASALLGLDFLPPRADLARRMERPFALVAREDVRMAAYQLVRDAPERVGDGEMSGLGFELREEDGLEEEVAELLSQRGVIVAIDGL